MIEIRQATTTPVTPGDAPLPKRNGPRGMLPSTWLNRSVRIEYIDGDHKAASTSGTLLDWYPLGVVINLSAARTLLCWERLVSIELVED